MRVSPFANTGPPAARVAHVRAAWLLPYALLALFVAAILALLWFVHRHEREIEFNNLRRDTQLAELTVTRKLLAHQEFGDRLAGTLSSGITPETLSEQAEAYLRQNPEVLNAVWTRDDGSIAWSAPAFKDAPALTRERPALPERERMLRLTRATGRSTYTEPYRDYLNEPYIEYHSPVQERGQFHGTVSVTLSLRMVIQRLVPVNVIDKYRLSLLDAEHNELFRVDDARETFDLLTQKVTLTLPWRNLQLSVTSYKTDSLIGRTALIGLILGITGVLVWSLVSLRRRVLRQLAADSALVASHERFVTVLDSLDAAVVVSDMKSREILFSNESFSTLFDSAGVGAHADQVERNLLPLPSQVIPDALLGSVDGSSAAQAPMAPAAPAAPMAPAATLTAGAGVHKAEVQDTVRHAWYLLRVRAIRWVDGRMVRLSMLSDISDRKAADERNRIQQEKLLLSSRLMSVGEMASTLAHEINQPLAAIANYNMGCVRRLKSGQWNQSELLTAMEKSSAQAERAGKVVRRVREFLRKREPQREPCDLNAIIEEVTELSEIEADRAGAAIRHLLAPGLPLVDADQVMLEQLLLNLFKNGIDAMRVKPAGTRILTVSTHRRAAGVEVVVADHGSGIAAEVEAELFSPFFTTKEQGMGMGLNICRSIVELHEGRLWYQAPADGSSGSEFHFTLPCA